MFCENTNAENPEATLIYDNGCYGRKMFTLVPPITVQKLSSVTMKRDVDAKRLLRTRPPFSRSLLVSVAVADTQIVKAGMKANVAYYRDVH